MEQEIIKELLSKYKIESNDEITSTYLKLINLGFNNIWLRNMCIIREFDQLYNTQSQRDIYFDLGYKHKIHEDSIRRIVANRKQYEI